MFTLEGRQHQLPVRALDPTAEWKWRLLEGCVSAGQADSRYLPDEVLFHFGGDSIAHTQSLNEHGVEADALVDVSLASKIFTERLAEEERRRMPKITRIGGMAGWYLDQVSVHTDEVTSLCCCYNCIVGVISLCCYNCIVGVTGEH